MRKLKLEELRVATFATTPEARGGRGTVVGNSDPNSRWDCSIDFCDGTTGPSVGGHCQSYALNPCYPSDGICTA